MKTSISIVLLASLLFSSMDTSAQIKGLLRDKAMEAIQKQKKEEDQKKQEEEKPAQQESSKPRNNPGSNFMQKKMMGAMGFSNVKFEPNYNFTSSMAMEIETVDSLQRKEKVLYTTYFNPNDKSFAMVFDAVDRETGEKQKSTIVLDTKNWAMLILTDKNGEKNGIAMKIDPDSSVMASGEPQEIQVQTEELYHPYYKATGRTKMVAGYRCKEYEYRNPEGSISLWATNDYKLNFSNAYGYMNGLQALATAGWGWGMGMVMEMVFKDADSPARTHMLVKEILPNSAKRLSITDYNVIGFGGQK